MGFEAPIFERKHRQKESIIIEESPARMKQGEAAHIHMPAEKKDCNFLWHY